MLIVIALTSRSAVADALDTFNLSVGTNIMYDSNVFRLSPSIDPMIILGTPNRSDLIITSTGTISANKTYGMQRFELSGSLVDNRYHNFEFLNFIAKNYAAAWHWRITPYLHGKLTANHKEALNNFANLTGFINSANRNLRTNDEYRFDGIFEANRSWHFLGGIAQTIAKNSLLTVQDFDNKVFSLEGGIRYTSSSGGSLTYRVRRGEGEFMKRPQPILGSLLDTRFHEMEHGIHLVWPLTGKTSIEGRIGHLERKHEHFPQRNFSGMIGSFDINWWATSKIHVTASWRRDLFNSQTASAFQLPQFQRFSSSYALMDRFSIAPVWQVSPKVVIRLRYDYMTRDFLGPIILLPTGDRSDAQHVGMVSVDWQPITSILLSAMLQRDHRSSNLRGFDYQDTAGSISVRLNF